MLITNKKDLTSSFSEFSNLIPSGVYWLNTNHELMGANDFILKTAGMKLEDILGKTPLEMHPKDMGTEIIAHHKQVIKTGKQVYCQEQIVNPESGNIVYFDVALSPLFDECGNIFGVCGISYDITERKRLEEETIHQKNQLEKKIAFQRNYLRSYGYEWVDALKNISHAIDNIGAQLIGSTVPESLEIAVNDELYKINESLSEMYTMYQKINSTIISENDSLNSLNSICTKPMLLKGLIAPEIGIANASISARFDVEVSFEMDNQSQQKVYVDYKKLRHIIRTLLANYTKGISKNAQKNINLKITARDRAHDKLYITFEFKGTMPFIELEDDNISAEYFTDPKNTNVAMDKHEFAYDLALAKHYVKLLCENEVELNNHLFEGSEFSFTLPFVTVDDDEMDEIIE
ncbi:PAS domain-containing protein [Cysteiniphilum sp. 6C5]|uniref:PAS domain-containing sensor histidine kinase n=1 Tax=unclassified Cysteiniphilum TaxID=2610889 RepID=UPI003F87C2B9